MTENVQVIILLLKFFFFKKSNLIITRTFSFCGSRWWLVDWEFNFWCSSKCSRLYWIIGTSNVTNFWFIEMKLSRWNISNIRYGLEKYSRKCTNITEYWDIIIFYTFARINTSLYIYIYIYIYSSRYNNQDAVSSITSRFVQIAEKTGVFQNDCREP